MTRSAIRERLLQLAAERAPGKTFCPSEVARSLSSDWRPLMQAVREEAALQVDRGRLICTQKGEPAHPIHSQGAIRLALNRQ